MRDKRCPRCDTVKPVADFTKNRSTKDGLHSYCRTCKRSFVRAPPRTPEQIEAAKQRRREKMRGYVKAWQKRNPDKVRAKRRREAPARQAWGKANPTRKAAHDSTSYHRHSPRRRAKQRARYRTNPEPYLDYAKARRARIGGLAVGVAVKARTIFERDNWHCGICRVAIDSELRYPSPLSASLDHINPLLRGGKHEPGNLQAAHLVCNKQKWATTRPSV